MLIDWISSLPIGQMLFIYAMLPVIVLTLVAVIMVNYRRQQQKFEARQAEKKADQLAARQSAIRIVVSNGPVALDRHRRVPRPSLRDAKTKRK